MSAPEGGGFIHTVPLLLSEAMTAEGMSFSLLPWQAPAYLAAYGETNGDAGCPALCIAYEWPSPWLRTQQGLSQFELELVHLRRFSVDQALAKGVHAFGNIREGPNPPDTLIDTDRGTIGVECTSMTIPALREAHGLFAQMRRAVAQSEPAYFANLRGHVVYVWFGADGAEEIALPFPRSDQGSLDQLIVELGKFEPSRDSQWLAQGEGLPEKLSVEHFGSAPGAKFNAVPCVGAIPATLLFSFAGFELGLAYSKLVTIDDGWGEIDRLITKHDKPGVDQLIISAGAPNQLGLTFPAEEAVAHFLVENPSADRPRPEHIETVVLHSWATGRATLLHPRHEPLFGPIYTDLAPSHHPLAPIPEAGETVP